MVRNRMLLLTGAVASQSAAESGVFAPFFRPDPPTS